MQIYYDKGEQLLNEQPFLQLMELISELNSLKEKLNYIYVNQDLRDYRKYFIKTKNSLKADEKNDKEAFIIKFVGNFKKEKKKKLDLSQQLGIYQFEQIE